MNSRLQWHIAVGTTGSNRKDTTGNYWKSPAGWPRRQPRV